MNCTTEQTKENIQSWRDYISFAKTNGAAIMMSETKYEFIKKNNLLPANHATVPAKHMANTITVEWLPSQS